MEIVNISAEQTWPWRAGAPGRHVFDDLAGAVHLGAVANGELLGVLSALPIDPKGDPDTGYRGLVGPFGEAGEALVDAVIAAQGYRVTLWADTQRPRLLETDAGWRLSIEPPPVDPALGYSSRHIRVLSGLQAVRKRPGMYVGSTGPRGRLALVQQAIDNALDEHLAGHAQRIEVWTDPTGMVTVRDDGRGIPLEVIAKVCLQLHTSATWDDHWPHVHLGGWGLGLAVLNALSSVLVVESYRDGRLSEAVFARGRMLQEPREVGPTEERGTILRFRPDPTVFLPDLPDLGSLLREAAYFLPDLSLWLDGECLSQPGGLAQLVRDQTGAKQVRVLFRDAGDRRVTLLVAPGSGEQARMWVNLTEIRDGTNLRSLQRLTDQVVYADVRHRVPLFDDQTRSKFSDPKLDVLFAEMLAGG